MYWLAIVSSFLLVPPIGMRVAELAFDRRRVGISTILHRVSLKEVKGCTGANHSGVLSVSLHNTKLAINLDRYNR
jgi:hypothetical protein